MYASTPQSKTGFAPFAIGFTVFTVLMQVGISLGPLNVIWICPSILAGDFTQIGWIVFGDYCGASAAALLVHHTFRLGLPDLVEEHNNGDLEAGID